jgi:hypothetical protein
MKGIVLEEISFDGGFALNRLGEFGEQLIEGCGCRKFEHDQLGDQLS